MKHLLWLLALAFLAGCNFPQDPSGTLERVKGGVLRVGISENPPWTILVDGKPAGIEADLAADLAAELGSRIVWVHGPEADLIQALHDFDLDLVVGGLTQDRPWKQQAAFTRSYIETIGRVGVPPGLTPPAHIEGREVLVRPASGLTKALREKKAQAIPAEDLQGSGQLVAAEDWELSRWRYRATPDELVKKQHVLALPTGENGWLMYIEGFLQKRKSVIRKQLYPGERP